MPASPRVLMHDGGYQDKIVIILGSFKPRHLQNQIRAHLEIRCRILLHTSPPTGVFHWRISPLAYLVIRYKMSRFETRNIWESLLSEFV
jgi:hypothetical protein